jgi:hypothetical protein
MEIGLVPDFDIDFPACSFLHFPFHVWQVLLAKLIKLYIPGFERLQHPDSVKCLGCSSEFPARWLNRIRTRQHMHDRISWVKGRELMWQLLAGYPDLCWCDDSLLLMALESCYPSIKWIQKDPKRSKRTNMDQHPARCRHTLDVFILINHMHLLLLYGPHGPFQEIHQVWWIWIWMISNESRSDILFNGSFGYFLVPSIQYPTFYHYHVYS